MDQPSLAKEIPPAIAFAVGLGQAADQGIGGEAEFRRGDGVKLRQQPGGVALGVPFMKRTMGLPSI